MVNIYMALMQQHIELWCVGITKGNQKAVLLLNLGCDEFLSCAGAIIWHVICDMLTSVRNKHRLISVIYEIKRKNHKPTLAENGFILYFFVFKNDWEKLTLYTS